jgi:peptidoglycan/xylan/chitin deacetylase (PgdA/CDA1 family)
MYERIPADLSGWIHNIDPDEFFRQMLWCKRNFDLLPLDAAAESGSEGSLSISFDDGNETVFSVALPMLRELGIPATVFLNDVREAGSGNWRDKIRIVLRRGWRAEFAAFAFGIFGTREFGDDQAFFLATKECGYDSRRLDAQLDRFLEWKLPGMPAPSWHRPAPDALPRHPLIRYGNHSANHYLLASLPAEEQEREIEGFHHRMVGLGLPMCGYFAVPFGRSRDMTPASERILKRLGYRGYALNGSAGNGADGNGAEGGPAMPRLWTSGADGLRRLYRMSAPSRLNGLESSLAARVLGKRAAIPARALLAAAPGNSIPP